MFLIILIILCFDTLYMFMCISREVGNASRKDSLIENFIQWNGILDAHLQDMGDS